MTSKGSKIAIAAAIIIVAAGGIAAAGSHRGVRITSAGIPLLAVIIALVFVIQWLMYVHAWVNKTEKFYDLTGSVTYILMTIMALSLSPNLDCRAVILGAIVILWAGRLGSYLFIRVISSGGDDRFDQYMDNPLGLWLVWTLQALWITCTALAAWIGITSLNREAFGWLSIIGVVVWAVGFTFELIADHQKSQFRKNPKNKGEFIREGIWSISRHPNYFGEIVMWTGVLVITAPALSGWQWIAVVSPLFVTMLLTKVSGIPLLEQKADTKWGGRTDYEEYKRATPVLVPYINGKK